MTFSFLTTSIVHAVSFVNFWSPVPNISKTTDSTVLYRALYHSNYSKYRGCSGDKGSRYNPLRLNLNCQAQAQVRLLLRLTQAFSGSYFVTFTL